MKRLTEYIQYSQNSIVSYQFGSLLVFWMLTVQSSRVNSTKSIERKFHRLQQSMTRKCEFQNKKTEFRFFYFDLIEWTVHGILLNHRTTSTLFHRHPRKFNWIQVQILDNANSPKQKKYIFFYFVFLLHWFFVFGNLLSRILMSCFVFLRFCRHKSKFMSFTFRTVHSLLQTVSETAKELPTSDIFSVKLLFFSGRQSIVVDWIVVFWYFHECYEKTLFSSCLWCASGRVHSLQFLLNISKRNSTHAFGSFQFIHLSAFISLFFVVFFSILTSRFFLYFYFANLLTSFWF